MARNGPSKAIKIPKTEPCSSPRINIKSLPRAQPIAPYICALCKKGFTRKSTVKDPHFPSCVRRNGNPKKVAWDSHPSCYSKLPDGSMGPSGESPAGLTAALQETEDAVDSISNVKGTRSGNSVERNESYGEVLGESEEDWEGADSSYMEKPKETTNPCPRSSSPPVDDSPTDPRPWTHESIDGFPRFATHKILPVIQMIQSPLSRMALNQLANIIIGASRRRAAVDHENALELWMLWKDLLPRDTMTKVNPPLPSFNAIQRKQAVVWLAQDVYAADLKHVETIQGRLQVSVRWMEILFSLNDNEALVEMEKLLFQTLG